MSASSRSDSNTNLDLLDETYGNITDEVGGLSVLEREFDRRTQIPHNLEVNFSSAKKYKEATDIRL